MINNYFIQQIKEFFSFQPTQDQEKALENLGAFLFSPSSDSVFILRGYAGTGKTTLVSALVKAMDQLKQKVVLLAPTGRAAKVFSHFSNHTAYTIHKRIYRQKKFDEESRFDLSPNLAKHTLYIVDEASMISNTTLERALFGTGRLLDDLMQYVYSEPTCRILFLGDMAQLPPVGDMESPALSTRAVGVYGFSVMSSELKEVVRQSHQSGVLWNATVLRQHIVSESFYTIPSIKTSGFKDIQRLPGDELIETLDASYSRVGLDETIVITRSNKRANLYNNGIRNQILYREEELSSGDWLMVTKNNYFWAETCKELDFIANGDIARVKRVRNTREMYGFRFADVTLRFPDYESLELEVTVILDTLHIEAPALTREKNAALFYAVLEDYQHIRRKPERMKAMKKDPYYNALQIKYAYAVTCHKAQGGQWEHVYIDQGYLQEEALNADYYRWLYTAFTRATKQLYLVNYPEDKIE